MRATALFVLAAAAAPALLAARYQEPVPGQRTYETVCAACHGGAPAALPPDAPAPAPTAPPMANVARRYLAMTGDSAAAVARVTAWLAEPAAEHSLLPAMAVQRHGLMPPVLLPDAEARAVAAYVIGLAAQAPGDRPMGMGGRGMGGRGMHGHGMGHLPPPDTTGR